MPLWALIALVLFGGCATRNACAPTSAGESPVFEILRSSGGVVLELSRVALDADGRLSYSNGVVRCVQLNDTERARLEEQLSSAALLTELARVADQNYKRMYYDAPHVLVTSGDVTAFVPIQLVVKEPLETLLSPLDKLLRTKFGRAYRYPLLPAGAEREEYRALPLLVGDGN